MSSELSPLIMPDDAQLSQIVTRLGETITRIDNTPAIATTQRAAPSAITLSLESVGSGAVL